MADKVQIDSLELEARYELDRRNGATEDQIEKIKMMVALRGDYEIVHTSCNLDSIKRLSTKELIDYCGSNRNRDITRRMLWEYVDDYIQYGIWTDDEVDTALARQADRVATRARREAELEYIQSVNSGASADTIVSKLQVVKVKRYIEDLLKTNPHLFERGEE